MTDGVPLQDQFARVLALRKLANQLELDAVEQAIHEGWTWAQIGSELGVSAQAAHKRLARIVGDGKDKA